ncbi:MAG: hypothetical protein IT209_04440 [Armatimonadetes bacterium]|nr:hypothetical protein [Armatimonadota bacterium]
MTLRDVRIAGSILVLTVSTFVTCAVPATAQRGGALNPGTARFNTIWGPTGMIAVPTADVSPTGEVQVGAAFGQAGHQDFQSYSANVGVANNVEIGGAWIHVDGSSSSGSGGSGSGGSGGLGGGGEESLMASQSLGTGGGSNGQGLLAAKVRLESPQIKQYQLGIGVFTDTDDIDTTWYAVVSTDILHAPRDLRDNSVGVRLHLGYGSKAFDKSIIGGGELFFNNRVSAVVEYDGYDVNAALRYSDPSNWRAQVGIFGDNSDLFGSVAYNWHF